MEKLRVGIIGVGGIAVSRHIPSFLALGNDVEVTAVCDVNAERAETVAQDYQIPFHTNEYTEIFDHVDAVTICTPNKFHADIAIAALQAGKHVLCEKPMAMSTEECEAMIQAADAAGKILMIAYHYRHTKEARAAKRFIDGGEIGRPLVSRAQAIRRRKVPGWGVFTNKDLQGGGSLIDFGCHFLDLALHLMDFPEIAEVSGATYNELSRQNDIVNQWGTFDPATFEVDDHATAYIKFKDGATLLFETSWAANLADDQETVSVSGTKGGLDVYPLKLYQAKYGMLLDQEAYWISDDENPGIPQAINFVESCRGNQQPLVKPQEALIVSKVIEAIYESSETGQAVRFS
ncbi:Gfo/Idh/MocA family protein [Jeotgalibacillus sp. R-1-5s-1]|uniref:Gfo/Idh/MocA family protein n=1 Tax=Jeotgalibacillus sp. R-1-5s-1 TaxID=2555897 RepID=UPI00106C314B|nr:Gfo/Idh/MocA family oxidoreductase [Jeotgalibacillus sp. R-1-5s-1]TFD99890.1 Gfo/Idh/MocA family oxidoreductase [Jeotgalibacillus sp. R-1-5s-1]